MKSSSAAFAEVKLLQRDLLHVLVVEDEMVIRFMVCDASRDGEVSVIDALNGDEVVDSLLAGETVDLIFIDVRMPRTINGLGLLSIVANRCPETPVILTSGHLDVSNDLALGVKAITSKPNEIMSVTDLIALKLSKKV